MLSCHVHCVFSHLCCNGHGLLLSSYSTRIGRIENPSCSTCEHLSQDTSDLILHCPATDSLMTLCLVMISGPDHGELPGFWGSMVFSHAPIPRKGSGKQQQVKIRCNLIDKSLKTLCQVSNSERHIIPNKRTKRSDGTSFICKVQMHQNLMEGTL